MTVAPRTSARARTLYLRPWRVDVTIREGVRPPVPLTALVRTMVRALDAGGGPQPASIGLILSDDAELAGLNATHLGTQGPTDVLSFPLLAPGSFPDHPGKLPPERTQPPAVASPGAFVPPGRRIHLGDVVVSVERAVRQASEGGGGQTGDMRWSPAEELRLLVAHGVLHVCGWDHAEPLEGAAMRELERTILASA